MRFLSTGYRESSVIQSILKYKAVFDTAESEEIMKIQETIERLQGLAADAANEMLLLQQELSAWQHRALELQIRRYDPDSNEVQEHLAQLNELCLDPSKFDLGTATQKVAELSAILGENIIEFCSEIPTHLTAKEIFGIPDPALVCDCGHTLDSTDEFCPVCGTRVGAKEPYKAPETISCRKCICGRTYEDRFKFCPSCGVPAEKSMSEKQKSIAETFGL